jgi:hypothetical protein
MTSNLVTRFGDPPDQSRVAIRNPTENKNCRTRGMLVEKLQDTIHGRFHARRQPGPLLDRDGPLHFRRMKILLNVYSKDVPHFIRNRVLTSPSETQDEDGTPIQDREKAENE